MNRVIRILIVILVMTLWMPSYAGAFYPTDPRGILLIPAIDLDEYIQTGSVTWLDGQRTNDLTTLGDGVTWLAGTGWINTPHWRIALAGHTPGAFERLHELQTGDAVYLVTEAGLWSYQVMAVYVVQPGETWVLNSDSTPSIALITCFGEHRLVVIAERENNP